MTPAVLNIFKVNNIFPTKVPTNIINLCQPLDLTVNGYAQSFMKRMFTEWFGSKIFEALESGKAPEEIDVRMNLSILKPLQAGWIIKLYDEMTSLRGKNCYFERLGKG